MRVVSLARILNFLTALIVAGVVSAMPAAAQQAAPVGVGATIEQGPLATPAAPPASPPTAKPTPALAAPRSAPVTAAPKIANSVGGDAYFLGAGDRLRISVFGEPDLSGEFLVDGAGNVAFPLVGQIGANGLTLERFESAVEQRLREAQILNTPSVSAEVLNFRPFYILGEVAKPGTYPYTSGLDVFSAVATAGGFTALANQTRVLIKRSGEPAEQSFPVESNVVPVRPGDTVRIVKGSIYVLGEVQKPGEYPFSSGMSFHSAVAAAGGFTYRANRRKVFIRRELETTEQQLAVTPALPVQPGDTIRVPECILCY